MPERRADRPQPPRRRAARLFGEPVEAGAPTPRRNAPEAPRSLRTAAALVALEAALLAAGALVLIWLTVAGRPDSVPRALAAVVAVAAAAAVLGAAAAGLRRVAGWARGPVIVIQLLFGALGYAAAFEAQLPLIGLPVLLLVAAVLYLLATPESRLAYLRSDR